MQQNFNISKRQEFSLKFIEEQAKEKAFNKEQLMIVHDLRKPFSQFKGLCTLINSCKTFEEFEELRSSILPDVAQTFDYGLTLTDRMLGSPKKLVLEKEYVSPTLVFQEIVDETLKINKYTDIDFDYKFENSNLVQTSKFDLKRIFANIINNAIEAMNHSGKIILKTRNIKVGNQDFTQFSIKNFGSCIPKGDLKFVFADNYTKGKADGHGLGLAIVKKIVTENGGTISCHSEPNRLFSKSFVEFIFTLPSKVEKSEAKEKNLFFSLYLPGRSTELKSFLN